MGRTPFEWEIPHDKEVESDTLLSSLVMLTQYYKSPCSKRTLTTNLPLQDNKLTPSLFLRAAERANFDAQIQTMKIKAIKKAVLPAVVLLKSGEACLLIDRNDEYARVLFMETGSGINSIKISELEDDYSGIVILVKPNYHFSYRSQETFTPETKNWFWKVIFKAWPLYIEVLFASALVNVFALAMPLFVMNVYDRVVPNLALDTLWVLASGIFLVFSFDFILRALRGYFVDSASKRIDVQLSARIFSQVLGINMTQRPQSVGGLANTVQSFETFREFITSTTITVFVDLPFVFLFIFIIKILDGPLYLIPLIMVPIVMVVGLILQWPLIKLTRQTYQLSAEKQAALIESLTGIETIKSCGAESQLQSRWESTISNSAHLGSKLRLVNNMSVNFTTLSQQLVSVSVVILGVYEISRGDLTMGALIACTILSGRAIAPMAQVAALFTRYYQSVNALKSINRVMQMDTDIKAGKKYLNRPNLDGSVEFKSVDFDYGNEQLKILNNMSFKINPGERVGIIGAIGCGKSTIAKLILGLYEPSSGSILIGGVAQDQVNPADLRYQIGYVPQDIVLFYGSIKDNIIFGAAHVDDDAVLKAAHLSGVDAFVKRHPEGYDCQVGERGKNISPGQRQGIALARAMLLSPKLLVLDEPCASMDIGTERRVCENIEHVMSKKDVTLIMTTHKLSLLRLVDRVIVIGGGKIIMDGPRDKVLQALRVPSKKPQGQKND